jgi:hypothetical protein
MSNWNFWHFQKMEEGENNTLVIRGGFLNPFEQKVIKGSRK